MSVMKYINKFLVSSYLPMSSIVPALAVLLARVMAVASLSILFSSVAMASGSYYEILEQLKAGFGITETLSVIFGVGLISTAFFKFKRFSEQRGSMMTQGSATPAVLCLLGGCIMCSLPSTIGVLQDSLWGTSHPLASTYDWNLKPVLQLTRLIGVVTIMRSILMFTRYSGENASQGTLSKAMLTLFVGLCLAHILGAAKVIDSFCGGLL